MSDGINKYALVGDEAVLFQHEGQVNKQVLLDTLPQLEQILDSLSVDRQKKRKIVNIAIETLQNLQLHSFQQETAKEYGLPPMFMLTKNKDHITIIIGNLVANSERAVLEDKLRKINSLNEEEIKFLYGVIMKQTVVKFSTKGGAGLGLIDMKKKSGNDLGFSFQDVDDEVCYFNLRISVPC
ncbi:MAG: hypothetical protein GC178_09070 [Flavobacteriales bacterium]|nr:hypothetical protein [Flavobacteriales bacterium]